MPESCAADTDCRKEVTMKIKKLKIAYERLSRDDEAAGDSLSIQNQKSMLEDYAARNGISELTHLVDDGWSGTRWDRPGIVRLIDELERDNVELVLLKDMSRLGRDHLRVGLLLEQFREKGVRLIAVGEGIDTEKGEDDFMPFRNIFSEWHARDTSRKIKAVFKSRMENGKRCSGAIPYGYKRNNGDTQDLIIDEEAAMIVRRIFQMIIEGMGVNDIARTLMAEKIPIPSEHWKQTGMEVRAAKYTDPYGWTPTTVSYIVAKPEYKGTVVLGKTKNISVKGVKKAVKTPPEEWYIFENALPVIVDAETWDNAQRLKRTVRRAPKTEKVANPLTGLLVCGDCEAKLTHRYSRNKNGWLDNSYCCSRYRGLTKLCTMHYISVKHIEKLILDSLRRVSCYVRDNRQGFIERVRAESVIHQENTFKENKKLLIKFNRRYDELNGLIRKLYEGNANGKIPDKHFERMLDEYDGEQTDLETKIEELETTIDSYNADNLKIDKFIELAARHTEFETLTPLMLNEFINKVVIYEKDKTGDVVTRQIDIHLNFIGNFTVPEDFDEYSPAERAAINAKQERLDKKNAYENQRRKKKREEIAAEKSA